MMETTGLSEMDSIGDFFTWFNKRSADPIYSRIDRVLANVEWFQNNTNVTLNILSPSVSDHALLYLVVDRDRKPKSAFKFNNYMVEVEGFEETVRKSWNKHVTGRPMCVLWCKLSRLRYDLKSLHKPMNAIRQHIIKSRQELQNAQDSLGNHRFDSHELERIKKLTEDVIHWNAMEEKTMMQKSKIDWLKMGDENSAFFHACVKSRHNLKSMKMLQQSDGTILSTHLDIEQEVLQFYSKLMGAESNRLRHVDIETMRNGKQVNSQQREYLVSRVTEDEIERALNGIGDLKSPGIDGYGAKFFKACWHIIKNDIVAAVIEFFDRGYIYKPFNTTVVTLIPKHEGAKGVKDYRPIAGCTTFYKIISKILTARLGKVLQDVISLNQAAFIPGQNIHNHIMLAYELVKGYGRKGGSPRCMIQLDLQKAYDMVDWRALEIVMQEIGLPSIFIDWIMMTVKTVSYRFNINGQMTDLLQARRGIRQGDPISPLLFVIIMEYFNRLLNKMQADPNFAHHTQCKKMNLTHLTFADDVLLFCRGDMNSVSMMLEVVKKFSESTGLVINPNK